MATNTEATPSSHALGSATMREKRLLVVMTHYGRGRGKGNGSVRILGRRHRRRENGG